MTKATPAALIVLHAFGRYRRGDLISDPVVIAAILNGGNRSLVLTPALPEIAEAPVNEAPVSHLEH